MRKPLKELLKDNVERTWTAVHQQAKEKIKDALFNTPVLQYFDLGIPVVIYTDSSPTGLSAMLPQKLSSRSPRCLSCVDGRRNLLPERESEKEAKSLQGR